jgi:hypothetical protein
MFWDLLDKNGPIPAHRPGLGACWLWVRAISSTGYGSLWVAGEWKQTHVYAYELHYGPLSPETQVLHLCDTRPCCNPAHLRPGTQQDNMRDMASKGRQALQLRKESRSFGDRNGTRTHPETRSRGEAQHCAKLTVDLVRYARVAVEGGQRLADLAKELGVTRQALGAAVKGKTWRHV